MWCKLSANSFCKSFVHDCKRLVEISASCCKELWKTLCYNARKKDLVSCIDLLSYPKKVFGGSVL
jgi:hypothetical protein